MGENRPMYDPAGIDAKLRIGIFRLLDGKYRPRFGNQSKFFCAAIFNHALSEPPGNDEAKAFLKSNERLIEQEAGNLCLDQHMAAALSILYTFTLIRIGPTDPERSMTIVERATKLNIAIRSTEELYPTTDAIQFLAFLDEFASRLLDIALTN
jgi:hypothetical protein